MTRISETVAVGDGITDDTAVLQAALDAAAGGMLEFDSPGTYKIGKLNIRSGTTIVLSRAVSFVKRANAAGMLSLSNVEGVRIHANGATLYGTDPAGTTALGHSVYALGAVDCEIRDLTVDSASAGKDCLYIGLGTQPCNRLRVIGGRYLNAKRNGISVVAGHNTLLQDLEAAYATGAPGAGVDIEANNYYHVSNTHCVRVHAHHNAKAGLLSVFGTGSVFEDCESHDNGAYGLGAGSGGYQFAETVYRPNVDMIGVSRFDPATGVIIVGAQPPVGTPVNFSLRNGAQRPTEFASSYYVVSRHVGHNGIILGLSVRRSEVTSFATAGAGVMSADPYLSDIRLRAFVDGQSDRLEVRGGRYYNNATQGLFASGAGRLRFDGADVYGNGSNQVQVSYIRDVELSRLRVAGGAGMGIVASAGGGRLRIADCDVQKTGARGISVAEWTGAEIDRNSVTDCGAAERSSAKAGLHVSACLRPSVTRNRVTQAASNTTTLFGIYAEGTATGGTFTGNDLTGAGTSSANAMIVPAGSVKANNIGRDGALVP